MQYLISKIQHILSNCLGSGHLISASHTVDRSNEIGIQFKNPYSNSIHSQGTGFPLPPASLRMGYGSDIEYSRRAEQTQSSLREQFKKYRIDSGSRILDWGCASGRVIRGFSDLAAHSEVWGVDQDARCIAWNKRYLSPPFRFVTNTCWPHLPFADSYFDLVYGISVFTHLGDLVDAWLVEICRIMKPGGYAIFTVHDEHSLAFFEERGRLPFWLPVGTDLKEIAKHEVTIVRGGGWSQDFTIFRSDYIKREWGQYFKIVDILPHFEGSQTGIILKRSGD